MTEPFVYPVPRRGLVTRLMQWWTGRPEYEIRYGSGPNLIWIADRSGGCLEGRLPDRPYGEAGVNLNGLPRLIIRHEGGKQTQLILTLEAVSRLQTFLKLCRDQLESDEPLTV